VANLAAVDLPPEHMPVLATDDTVASDTLGRLLGVKHPDPVGSEHHNLGLGRAEVAVVRELLDAVQIRACTPPVSNRQKHATRITDRRQQIAKPTLVTDCVPLTHEIDVQTCDSCYRQVIKQTSVVV